MYTQWFDICVFCEMIPTVSPAISLQVQDP